MNRGDFILGFCAGLAVGVSISAASAVNLPPPPAPGSTLYMHLTLPETRDTATYVCTRVERRQANDPRNFR